MIQEQNQERYVFLNKCKLLTGTVPRHLGPDSCVKQDRMADKMMDPINNLHFCGIPKHVSSKHQNMFQEEEPAYLKLLATIWKQEPAYAGCPL